MTEELRKRAVNALWEELYVVGMTSEFYAKFIELFAFRLCVEDAMKEIAEEADNLGGTEFREGQGDGMANALGIIDRHLSQLEEPMIGEFRGSAGIIETGEPKP